MRWSNTFIPTLRDDPADAEAVSHKLLVRAGLIRQLSAGIYSILPLGWRVCRKIESLIRDEMDRIGAQEFRLPAMHPAELWQRSGRWAVMGDEMFRLKDRRGGDLCLGMTHEEVFTDDRDRSAHLPRAAADLVPAPDQVPRRAAPQIGPASRARVRDEGLLLARSRRSRSRPRLQAALRCVPPIFERCGLAPLAVEGTSGAMGGSESIEFMVASDAGEDWVASCGACGYAANLEKATSRLDATTDAPGPAEPEAFATPGVRSIEDLANFDGGTPAERQIKTLVYVLDGVTVLALLRGDHGLSEQKLADATGTVNVRAANADEIRAALGASAGSLGAVGVGDVRVVADTALQGRRDMTTGANSDEFHLRGVDVARDIRVDAWLELREVKAGEPCPMCGAALGVAKTIEVGHIFKLGTKYSEKLGAVRPGRGGRVGADRDGLVRDRRRSRDGVDRRSESRRERHHLARHRRPLRGRDLGAEPERCRNPGSRRTPLRRSCAPTVSR